MYSKLPSFGDYIDFLKRMMGKKKRKQSHNVLIAQPDFELVGDTSASASGVLGL